MGHEEAEFNYKDIKSIGSEDIDYLKKKATESKRGRYRLCLHNDTDHKTQEMFICLKKRSYFQPHKHPVDYSESYYMIEGMIDVYLMDDDGIIFEKIKLNDNRNFDSGNFYYRLSSSYYHFVVPRSEWTIHHEVSSGPFIKSDDLYGKFAPSENASFESIKKYVNNILGDESPYKFDSDE